MIKNYNIRKAYFDTQSLYIDRNCCRNYYQHKDNSYIIKVYFTDAGFSDVFAYSFNNDKIIIRERTLYSYRCDINTDDKVEIIINPYDILVLVKISNSLDKVRYLNRIFIYEINERFYKTSTTEKEIFYMPLCAFKFTNVNELLTINKRTKNKQIIDLVRATYSMLLLGNTRIHPVLLD